MLEKQQKRGGVGDRRTKKEEEGVEWMGEKEAAVVTMAEERSKRD